MTLLAACAATARRARTVVRLGMAARRVTRASSGDARSRARSTISAVLAEARGGLMKAGQIAASFHPGGGEYRALVEGVPPRPLAAVRPAIEASLSTPLEAVFRNFREPAIGASLGQVHRATLHDGTEVAVKVRYPGIEAAVAAELRLAGMAPGAGPVRAWGFDLSGYRKLLGDTLAGELDYLAEADRQERFAEGVRVPGLVVPRVFRRWCRRDLLVQSWEPGAPLREACGWPRRDRLLLAQTALRAFAVSLFAAGEVHGDPHPGNALYRRGGDGRPEMVLLDYGCTLALDPGRRRALLRLLLACREGDAGVVGGCLGALGFDGAKLLATGAAAVAYCRLVFEPWVRDEPFDAAGWRLRQRSEELLGDGRWAFRAAAPPDLLLFVRAYLGLVRQVEALGVRLPWWPVLAECLGPEALAAARTFEPGALAVPEAVPGGGARLLRVSLREEGRELFSLVQPAAEVFDLTSSVPTAVRRRLAAAGVSLGAVVRTVRRRGLVPQEVFSAQLDRREVRVWLE